MTGKCKTCVYWHTDPDDLHARYVAEPEEIETGGSMEMPFRVRQCKHPSLLFCERPVESNGFAVVDGSTYYASLITAEDFGCVLHTPTIDDAASPQMTNMRKAIGS